MPIMWQICCSKVPMRISCAHGSQLDLPSEVLIYDTVLRLMAGKESLQAFEGWLKRAFKLSVCQSSLLFHGKAP